MAMHRLNALVLILCSLSWMWASSAKAQSFGVESHNTLMPASGGMAGVSIAQPQDLTSALNGNPATLTQFQGTQFLFGGVWAEPTFDLTQTTPIPLLGVDPYAAKSTAQGIGGANIGVTQSMEMMGLPVVFGLGFITNAVGGADFRHVPQSNSTNSAIMVLELASSAGVQLTEQLSAGATLFVGTGLFDGPFVEIGGMTSDYALRTSLGLNYQLTEFTSLGTYYQSEQSFRFDNAVRFPIGPTSFDVNMDLPQNVGIGIANTALMEGQLLLPPTCSTRTGTMPNCFAGSTTTNGCCSSVRSTGLATTGCARGMRTPRTRLIRRRSTTLAASFRPADRPACGTRRGCWRSRRSTASRWELAQSTFCRASTWT